MHTIDTATVLREANFAMAPPSFSAEAYTLLQKSPENTSTDFFAKLGALVAQHAGALIVARYDATQTEAPLSVLHSQVDPLPTSVEAWCLSVANRCLIGGTNVTESSQTDGSHTYQLSCVAINGGDGQCLLALHQSHSAESVTQTLELAGPAYVHLDYSQQLAKQAEIVQQLAALTDLVTRLESADTCEAAAKVLSENLASYLESDHVVVAQSRRSSHLQVVAASHQDRVDHKSEGNQLAVSLLQESAIRNTISVWPAASSSDQHALLCHRQYAEHHQQETVLSCPLHDNEGDLCGALLIGYDKQLPSHARQFVAVAQQPLANTLKLIRRGRQTRIRRSIRNLFSKAQRHRLRTTAFVAALVCAVLCFPLQYKVKTRCQLEPTNKRFLAAPFDGKLLECLVEPGDIVEQNQLLARLDGQETEWELGSVNAELQRAVKERAGHMVNHESGKARLAGYEIEYLKSKAKLLEHRILQLEVRSPVSGVIVAGDLTKAEGVPLEVGQTLFEIAPLDSMIVELSVPQDDVRFVAADQVAKIHFDALPYAPYKTTIDRVRPRAEVRDDENVFVASGTLVNDSAQLRPGMEGTARVKSVLRPIGWILLHKPVAAAVGWLGL